jgi:hypothetical protein
VRDRKAGLRSGATESEGSENAEQRRYEQDGDEELSTTRK